MNQPLPPRDISGCFDRACAVQGGQDLYFPAIDTLMQELSCYQTEDEIQDFATASHIQNLFDSFLGKCDFQMARWDFSKLIKETHEELRDDGTLVWYHHLSPILLFLSKVRDGTIPLDALEEHGGLEVVLRTHLRHDSLEDMVLKPQTFGQAMSDAVYKNDVFSSARKEEELRGNALVYRYVSLMSKKHVMLNKNGKIKVDAKTGEVIRKTLFLDTRSYFYNMLEHRDASPIPFILKQGDAGNNQATLDTPKFPPAKRLKKCNELEDMYGGRHGFSDLAMDKWPEFAKAIKDFDALLGTLVYLNFGDLEYVELAYPDNDTKFKEGGKIYQSGGIPRYLDDAMNFKVPRAFHPVHMWLDREHKKMQSHHDPNIRRRTEDFLKSSIYPAFEKYKQHFPRIFPANDDQITSSPDHYS